MAIIEMMQYSTKTTYSLTWERRDGSAVDITGATLTGFIRRGSVVSKITGTLAVVTGTAGALSWAPSVADVTQAGHFFCLLRAKYSDGKYEISPWHQLVIHETTGIEFVSASTSPSGSASPSASPSPSS